MDNHANHPTPGTDNEEAKGCCGGAHQAKTVAEKETSPTDDQKSEKAGKSGCCCSGD